MASTKNCWALIRISMMYWVWRYSFAMLNVSNSDLKWLHYRHYRRHLLASRHTIWTLCIHRKYHRKLQHNKSISCISYLWFHQIHISDRRQCFCFWTFSQRCTRMRSVLSSCYSLWHWLKHWDYDSALSISMYSSNNYNVGGHTNEMAPAIVKFSDV